MNAIGIQPPKTWTVLGHIDATASDLQPYEMSRIDSLERTPKNDSHVVLDVRNAPNSKLKRVLIRTALAAMGAAEVAVGVGLGASMAIAGAPLIAAGLVGGAIVGAGVLTHLAVGNKALRDLRRVQHEPETPGTSWKGTRTYHLQQNENQPGISSPVIAESRSNRAPSGDVLGKFLADNMKRFPAQRYAFILGGHGRARDSVGGISVKDMAKATEVAHASSGRKMDVLVLDSCLVGNLETLLPMADHVRYAVVSEEPLYTGVVNFNSLIESVEGQAPSANQFVDSALTGAHGSGSPYTLSSVRMSQLPALRQALEKLGEAMDRGLHNGQRTNIQSAFKRATPIKDMGWLERKMEGKVDLGNLLSQLALVPDPSIMLAAAAAQNAYKRAVTGHTHTTRFAGTTGLSIQGPKTLHREAAYRAETGMPQWSKMLKDMRPWPLRMMSAVKDKVFG